MAERLTGAQLARLAGCTKSGVSKAAKKQLIPRGEDGLYDIKDPRVVSWLTTTGQKRGVILPELEDALGHHDEPADALAGRGEALEEESGDEAGPVKAFYLTTEANFGDGWRPIIRHGFGARALEIELFPVPFAIRIDYDGPTVYRLEDDAEIPTRIGHDGEDRGLERALEVRAV